LTCYLGDTVTAAGILPVEKNGYTAPNTGKTILKVATSFPIKNIP